MISSLLKSILLSFSRFFLLKLINFFSAFLFFLRFFSIFSITSPLVTVDSLFTWPKSILDDFVILSFSIDDAYFPDFTALTAFKNFSLLKFLNLLYRKIYQIIWSFKQSISSILFKSNNATFEKND